MMNTIQCYSYCYNCKLLRNEYEIFSVIMLCDVSWHLSFFLLIKWKNKNNSDVVTISVGFWQKKNVTNTITKEYSLDV